MAEGSRRRYLTPSSLSFDQTLNEVGSGSVTLPIRSITLADTWPHLTSIAFLRINGPGATPTQPVCEFLGMPEQVSGTSSGGLSLGLKSIEGYLGYRIIQELVPPLAGSTTFTTVDQTQIGADLVNLANPFGIPLTATAEASGTQRTIRYLDIDRKVVIEAVLELTALEDGPDYQLVHIREGQSWRSEMRFADYVGNTEPFPMNSQRGMQEYGIEVDASLHANRVIGIGSSSRRVYDADQSGTSIYPKFERSVAWTDTRDSDTLEAQTKGELANHSHPTTVPSLTLAGLDIATQPSVGDTIDLRLDHGAIQYDGLARLISKSWSSDADSPTKVTFGMVPQGAPEDDVLAVVPGIPGCC